MKEDAVDKILKVAGECTKEILAKALAEVIKDQLTQKPVCEKPTCQHIPVVKKPSRKVKSRNRNRRKKVVVAVAQNQQPG